MNILKLKRIFYILPMLLAIGALAVPRTEAAPTTTHGPAASAQAPSPTVDASTKILIELGRYVAQLGDCIACHTTEKGRPMAGGLALVTPLGKLYSTNITPDPKTGIGNYTFEQFDRAMRRGVAADGHNLYPAMPYPPAASGLP